MSDSTGCVFVIQSWANERAMMADRGGGYHYAGHGSLMDPRAVVVTSVSDGISGLVESRYSPPSRRLLSSVHHSGLPPGPLCQPRPTASKSRRMHGSDIEDELYSSYTSRGRLADHDDVDVDSPVLGLWADDEERRILKRRSGECMSPTLCTVDRRRSEPFWVSRYNNLRREKKVARHGYRRRPLTLWLPTRPFLPSVLPRPSRAPPPPAPAHALSLTSPLPPSFTPTDPAVSRQNSSTTTSPPSLHPLPFRPAKRPCSQGPARPPRQGSRSPRTTGTPTTTPSLPTAYHQPAGMLLLPRHLC